MKATLCTLLVCGFLTACAAQRSAVETLPQSEQLSRLRAPAAVAAIWVPQQDQTFQWDLNDTPANTKYPADVYDIDMFDNGPKVVQQLHSLQRHVICYISVGSYEDWRPDAWKFRAHPQVIGRKYPGWPGEWFIDIRRLDILGPIMEARFDLCKSKGFDAIEPDNVDTYQAKTGFPLTGNDQIAYNTWIAQQAHNRGLSVALKNDPPQAQQLQPNFDFALDEECLFYKFCNQLEVFTSANKAVFDVEYTNHTTQSEFFSTDCPKLAKFNHTGILKHLNLGAWIKACKSNM